MTSHKFPPIDLNIAIEDDLIRKLKLSPRLAKRIISMRPYSTVDELQRVWGMDAETLVRILPYICVGNEPEPLSIQFDDQIQIVSETDRLVVTADPSIPELPDYIEQIIALQNEPIQAVVSQPMEPIEEFDVSGIETAQLPLPEEKKTIQPKQMPWRTIITLGIILLVGAYFRLNNLNWDQNQHQHPDERFLTTVVEKIQPVSIGNYFNTQTSTLNPFQDGASYTYGMFPIFLTRMVAGWLSMTHYDKVVLVGRALSGLFDLAAVLLLYFLGKRIFNRRVGMIAGILSAGAVLQIQLSHYFTVDSFSTVFIVAAFLFTYLAIPLLQPNKRITRKNLISFALFGLAAGLAMATKINTIVIFGVIFLASLAYLVTVWPNRTERIDSIKIILVGLLISALTGFVTFRVFQPYAFMGPGFFGLQLNQRWLDVMHEVTGQVAGSSEWPPNHHWTSRPVTYAWTNMVDWGLGLPLGLAAWAAWGFAVWRCFKGEWRRLLLPVVWVGGYFFWQNMQFWRYMRYFVPIYPIIILIAAWGLTRLLDWTLSSREKMWSAFRTQKPSEWAWKSILPGMLVGLLILGIVGGTYVYAIAFSGIYTRPITRISASQWMLQNIRGPLNVLVASGQTIQSYPIASPSDLSFAKGDSFHSAFKPLKSGTVSEINAFQTSLAVADIHLQISSDPDGKDKLTEGRLILPSSTTSDTLSLNLPEVTLKAGKSYTLSFQIKTGGPVSASGALLRNEDDKDNGLPLDWTITSQNAATDESSFTINPKSDERINRLVFAKFQGKANPAPATIQVSLTRDDEGKDVLASTTVTQDILPQGQSNSPVFHFNPVKIDGGKTYFVHYEILSGGPVLFNPEPYTLETSWDDALPLHVEPYDALGAIYKPLNLELYDQDTTAKRDQMLDILDKVNYIVIPSNRAYDSMPRLPQRYPLSLKYYQSLFGCLCDGDQIEAKAYQLKPPFHSQLGFDLVATFTSDPSFGPITFPDEAADESFTVYDHPKVLIFKKSSNFSIDQVRSIIDSVDLTQVIEQSPLAVSKNPNGYQLPPDRLAAQQAGGTWSDMFNPQSILNSNQPLGVIAWYLTLLLLGFLFFPLTFIVFRGFSDRGYLFSRLISLLVLAWFAWMLSSLKVLAFTRWNILLGVVIFIVINGLLARKYKDELLDFIRSRWRYMLGAEALFAGLFLFGIFMRLGNPDLWQPWMGGEKPMDFAIFNAVLKSVYFPPPNAWFAGYYLNYYYYGYVIASILTKLLGIVPSIAYNIILPTWFALIGVGIFSVAYNFVVALLPSGNITDNNSSKLLLPRQLSKYAWMAGLAAVILMLFAGNLAQVRQIWKFLPEVSAGDQSAALTGFNRLGAVVSGAIQVVTGNAPLPGDHGRWYFEASRPILNGKADTPIAEFPNFTFLYGDMHPHMLTMPFMFLALAWIFALLLMERHRPKAIDRILFWGIGGLTLGIFRPAHTWDYPTFMGLAILMIGWTTWRAGHETAKGFVIPFLGKVVLLVGLSYIFYAPFGQWFATAYESIDWWSGLRTPLGDYLTVHGLFLFILVSFLLYESRSWITTAFNKWRERPFAWLVINTRTFIWFGAAIITFMILELMWFYDFQVFILVIPLLIWIGFLVFQKDLSLYKQLLYGLFAIGLCLTLLVELFVLKGDSGRQNMVFYFYIQVWGIFSLGAGIIVALLLINIKSWVRSWRWIWMSGLLILMFGALLYPLTSTQARFADRWPNIVNPPVSLDGMAYMLGEESIQGDPIDPENGAIYDDQDRQLNLGYDYEGIRFMQENVIGTPTIVEAQTTEYRWGSRYSVYTGLPTVVGWSWHVRQHNSLMNGSLVDKRIEEVKDFYNTTDTKNALDFLKKYHVGYVIVGSVEKAYYDSKGLDKFIDLNKSGILNIFFTQEGPTGSITIYHVK